MNLNCIKSKFVFPLPISFHRVQNLKDSIERLHGIPANKQVLMISGGEVLNALKRVSSYPSGTDENPIYMFSILFDSSKLLQPWPSESRKFHSRKNSTLFYQLTCCIFFLFAIVCHMVLMCYFEINFKMSNAFLIHIIQMTTVKVNWLSMNSVRKHNFTV